MRGKEAPSKLISVDGSSVNGRKLPSYLAVPLIIDT